MTMKEFVLTARGISSLFWPWLSVKPFVDDDWDYELKVNSAIARKSKPEIDRLRQEYVPVVNERLQAFRRVVWGSFWSLATAVITAVVIAAFWHASQNSKLLMGGASIFAFAWATLARLGRGGTSFGGNTVLERIDLRMLWILYWIGTLLGTLALI